MLPLRTKISARALTEPGLATTAAAFWLAGVAFTGPAFAGTDRQIGAARATAIHQCNVIANRYSEHDWGNTEIYQYRACMTEHGQKE